MTGIEDDVPRGPSGKPLPLVTPQGAPFWRAARMRQLCTQCCAGCGHRQVPPRLLCRRCGGRNLMWAPTAPRGSIYSFTVVHRPPEPAFAPDVPYVVAVVQLEEGGRIMANIVACDPGKVTMDMPVEAVFEDVTEEITVVHFQPVGA